jgi:hypothetical protein
VLATWAALFGAFGFYWVPGDVTFWLPALAAWWLLAALVIQASAAGGVSVGPDPMKRQALVGLAVGVIVLAVVNAAFEILPRRDLASNHPFWAAQALIEHTERDDLVLTRSDDILGLYAAYFGSRQVAYVTAQPGRLDAILDYADQQGYQRVMIADSEQTRAGWWRQVIESAALVQTGERYAPPVEQIYLLELLNP